MTGLGGLARTLAVAALVGVAACAQESPDQLIASAKVFLQKNEYKSATIQLKNALQADPNLPEARFLLGRAFLAEGNGVSAELEFRKALELKHPSDAVVPELARALMLQRRFADVSNEFGQSDLGKPAANADLKVSIAAAHASLGQMTRAQTAVDEALVAVPGDSGATLMQARLAAARGAYDAALKSVDQLIAKAPDNHEALTFKAELLQYAKNQPDAALEAFIASARAKPDFAAAHAGIVKILLGREQYDEAAKALAQLKKIAPDAAETRYLEAQYAYQKKDFRAAKELVQALLRAVPDDARYLQLAGAIEYQTNSPIQAEYFLGKALQKAPNLEFARRMLIATYLRSGQPKKAIAALPASIEKDTDAELLALAGQAYLQNGDAKRSEALLARASRLDPTSATKRTSLALAQLAGGKTDLAMGQLREIAGSETGTAVDVELVAAHLRRGEFDKALAAIDNLEKKDTRGPLPAQLRGMTYVALKDAAAARRNFERAISIDPTFFPAAVNLAALDLQEKNPSTARTRFDAILKRDPKHLNAMLALADVKARSGATVHEVAQLLNDAIRANPTDVTPRRALIDLYLRTKEYKLALSTAQEAVSALPQSLELLDALGRSQQASGESNQAVSTFNQLARMQPNSPQVQMRLAGTYLLEKNPAQAEQAWLNALRIQPDFLDAQRALVIYYLQSDKARNALEIARKVKEQRPKQSIGWEIEGDIGAAQKNWSNAAEAYRAGLKLNPSTGLASKLHAALALGDKQAEADGFAKTWLSEHPTDAALRSQLGYAALLKNDYAEAEKHYRAVLQVQPENALVLNNLAWISIQQKRPEAVELAEKANKIAPNQPAFMDTLALALSRNGQHVKAVELQKKAIGIQPDNATLKLQLAKIYLGAGDKKSARVELDRLAAMGSKSPLQQEVTKLLGDL